jgi:hypothetical protein
MPGLRIITFSLLITGVFQMHGQDWNLARHPSSLVTEKVVAINSKVFFLERREPNSVITLVGVESTKNVFTNSTGMVSTEPGDRLYSSPDKHLFVTGFRWIRECDLEDPIWYITKIDTAGSVVYKINFDSANAD